MIGFLIGTACLIGLFKVLRGGRAWGRWRSGTHRGRSFLRYLFHRLDTSPGQEKVIMAALEDMWTQKRALSDEFLQTRKDVARAMRGEVFDEVALGEAFSRQDSLLQQLRDTVSRAMKTVHEALDDRQRKLAGDMLEGAIAHGHHHHHHGGPYRSAWL
jgi:hypothetical protein